MTKPTREGASSVRRILVTGGAGFIGCNLVRFALEQREGIEIVLQFLLFLGQILLELDLGRDGDAWRELYDEAGGHHNSAGNGGGLIFVYAYGPVVGCVFSENTGSYGGGMQCYGNAQATVTSCTVGRGSTGIARAKVRLVFTSSSWTLSQSTGRPVRMASGCTGSSGSRLRTAAE